MDPDLDADDPYDVLGISRDATDGEVEDRTRRLLDEYTDDHAARTALNAAFEEIQQRPGPVEVGGTTVVPLIVSASPDTISAGEEVTIRVTDHTGEGISGVDLQRAKNHRLVGRTDDDGTGTVRFFDPGTYIITASKNPHPDTDHEYKDGEVELSVRARSASEEGSNADDSHDAPDGQRDVTEDEVRKFVRGLLDEHPDEYAARAAINEAFREVQQGSTPVEQD